MHRLLKAPLLIIGLFVLPGTADAKLTGAQGENSAKFNASGPAGLAIVGTTTGVTVSDDGSTVSVAVPLATLDTGISLRNRHMREKYLDVAKFPFAVLAVPRGAIKFPTGGAEVKSTAPATITLHGVSQPVTIQYSARNDGGTYRVVGTAPLNINSFGIQVPSYLGITVKPDVTVEVHFAVTDSGT